MTPRRKRMALFMPLVAGASDAPKQASQAEAADEIDSNRTSAATTTFDVTPQFISILKLRALSASPEP